MSNIKNNPFLSAIITFAATWAAFPVAALLSSAVRGISFAEAACAPSMIIAFAAGSIVGAVSMYLKKNNKEQ